MDKMQLEFKPAYTHFRKIPPEPTKTEITQSTMEICHRTKQHELQSE